MQVSMTEAAERLNLSVDTIRRRLTKGELKGNKESTPQGYRWRIDIPEDPSSHPSKDPSSHPRNARADATEAEAAQDQVDGAELALAAQDARIASLESQLQAKDAQIDQLHHLLAQSALQAAPARPWWKIWG